MFLIFIKNNKTKLLIIVLFLILPFIFFRDSFNLNNVILGNEDTVRYYIPIRQLITNLIKDGQFPFWNKYIFAGFPILAEPASHLFYPIILIFNLIMNPVLANNLSLLLHYSLAGIFMYLFLKSYKLDEISAFTGSLIFMFSGMMISYRSFAFFLYTYIWLPLILLFLNRFKETRKIKYLFLSSLFLLISFTGGFLQVFVYNCIIIFFYVIFYTFFYSKKKNYYFLLSFTIFFIVVLVGLVQIIPTLELMRLSNTRSSSSYDFFVLGSFNPKLFVEFVFPYIFGAKNPISFGIPHFIHWLGKEDSLEMMRYFGIATIPLFIFGLFTKIKERFFWLFLLFFSLFMVLGKYNTLYKLFYYIPFFNVLKTPTRYFSIFGFAFAVLCSFGMNFLINLNKNITLKYYVKSNNKWYLLVTSQNNFITQIKINNKRKNLESRCRNLEFKNFLVFRNSNFIIF